MQLQTAKQPGSRLELTFSLDAQDVNQAFANVFQEMAQQASIPGFRKGHVPITVVRRRTRPDMLAEMVWMRIIEDFVEKEVKAQELEVLGEPDMPDFSQIELLEGQPVSFTINFTVRPEPVLPDYSGLKLYRVLPEVTDKQVEDVIEQMRNAAAKEVAVEGRDTVETGDLVEAEVGVQLADAEEPLQTAVQTIEVGSGRYQPAIDEALLGHKVGETVEMPVDYSEDHEVADLAGKKGVIRATIQSLKIRELPELTDEFAQAQGEYESLEDLQSKMRVQLQERAEKQSRDTLNNDALSAVVRDTEIDVPQNVVEGVAARGVQNFMEDLQREGLSLQEFAEIAGADEAAIRLNERIRAEIALKVDWTLEAVAKLEEIEVGEEAIEEELALFGAENNLEADFLRQALDLQDDFRDQLESRASRRLTVQAILNKAVIEDVTLEQYEEIKKQEREAREAEAQAKADEAAAAAEAEVAEEAPAEAATESEETPAVEESTE